MAAYILRRLLLIIPTLFGIMVLNFCIIQFAPGGPIEQTIARLQGSAIDATARLGNSSGDTGGINAIREQNVSANASTSKYRGAQGLDPKFIAELEKEFGFDKPLLTRFWIMIGNYARFDFGNSYFKGRPVIDLILEKLPVSISIGLWSTLLTYLIAIPLGIRKAIQDGQKFDIWSSVVIMVCYAIPSYLFAVLLIVFFAGGRFFQIFPLRGLMSDGWQDFSLLRQAGDYLWHVTLPTLAMVISSFAGLTMLTKNSFIDELGKQYVLTARAKGLRERTVLYGHVFRNAMLIVISGFPAALIGILFSGSLLIEYIFNLDGLGLLGFQSAIDRDYPVMFGTLYIFTLIGLLLNLVSDLTYMLVDPRIDFEKSHV